MTGSVEIPPINSVLVVGAGTMGGGIAQVLAEANIETVVTDADSSALERGLQAVSARWHRAVQSGRRSLDEVKAAQAKLRTGADKEVFGDAAKVLDWGFAH